MKPRAIRRALVPGVPGFSAASYGIAVASGPAFDVGQLLDSAPQRLFPAGVDQIEVAISSGHAPITSYFQAVLLVQQQVKRGPNRHVRSHGGIERQKGILGGYFKRRCGLNAAVKNRST